MTVAHPLLLRGISSTNSRYLPHYFAGRLSEVAKARSIGRAWESSDVDLWGYLEELEELYRLQRFSCEL